MSIVFRIQNWTGKVCFQGIQFPDFDSAEEWLSIQLGDSYEEDRQEYYIVEVD